MRRTRIEVDVLVVGGGSAGLAAACGARRAGRSAAVVERYGFLGGMATTAEVGTICGLYLSGFAEPRFASGGFARSFSESVSSDPPQSFDKNLWFLPYNALKFRRACDLAAREFGVSLYLHTLISGVECAESKIVKVQAQGFSELYDFVPEAVVDASGEAAVSRLAGIKVISPEKEQAGALVFSIAPVNADPEIISKELLLQAARGVKEGKLPEGAERLSLVPGGQKPGAVSIKLALPEAMKRESNFMSRLECGAREKAFALARYLSESSPLFKGSEITQMASQAGIRTGARALGRYILNSEDVLNCRKRGDSAARGAWPVEKWDEDRRVKMSYLKEGDYYDIPFSALTSAQLDNLYFAGRNISADDDAIASARVIGTCLSTGFSAGALAALGGDKADKETLLGIINGESTGN